LEDEGFYMMLYQGKGMKRKVLLLIFIPIILCLAAILLLLTQTGNNINTSIPPAAIPDGFVRVEGGTFMMGSPSGGWDSIGFRVVRNAQ